MTLTPWTTAPRPPRRWQAEALDAVRAALGRGEAGIVSACTGAGKSALTAELVYLASAHLDLVSVVTVPTERLVEQTAAAIEARGVDCGRWYGRIKRLGRVVVVCAPSVESLAVGLAAAGQKVGLLIVDEVHGSESERMILALPLLAARWRVGLTATPYRSAPTQTLSIWQSIIYRYTFGDALRDGVLVPFRVINYDGDGTDDVDEVIFRMMEQTDGPGIISARHIEDATTYATWLQGRGVAVEAIHSQLAPKVQAARVAALESGALRCLVHVSMLAEGVDFPWLRWLGFRRPVGARVRLVQELGRGLRSHPGKRECVVLDPHDLLGTLGIAHPEALGLAIEAEEADVPRRVLNPTEQEAADMPAAVVVDEVGRWARGLVLALQADGLLDGQAVKAGRWRGDEPSESQITALTRLSFAHRYMPEEHQPAVLAAVKAPWSLSRGAASDLIDVLGAMVKATREQTAACRESGNWRRKIVGWPRGLVVEPLAGAAQMRLGMGQ